MHDHAYICLVAPMRVAVGICSGQGKLGSPLHEAYQQAPVLVKASGLRCCFEGGTRADCFHAFVSLQANMQRMVAERDGSEASMSFTGAAGLKGILAGVSSLRPRLTGKPSEITLYRYHGYEQGM